MSALLDEPTTLDTDPASKAGPFALPPRGEMVILSTRDIHAPLDPDQEHRRVHKVTERIDYRLMHRLDGTISVVRRYSGHYKGTTWPRRDEPWTAQRKSFSRWTTEIIHSITAHPDGPWMVRIFQPRLGWQSHLHFLDAQVQMPPELLDIADQYLAPPIRLAEHYPCLSHYVAPRADGPDGPDGPDAAAADPAATIAGIHTLSASHRWAPTPVRAAFAGAPDAQALTRALFGKSRYRRDLVKAVSNTSLTHLCLAHQFRGLVPIDWIITLLNSDTTVTSWPAADTVRHYTTLRPLLRTLDQHSLKRLLSEGHPRPRLLYDLARMTPKGPLVARLSAGEIALGRVTSWEDLHDRLVDLHHTYGHVSGKRRRPARPHPDHEVIEGAIEGATAAGLRIELARHEDTLWAWGEKMRHCIGSYGDAMRSGRSLLGAVSQADGTLVANFEIGVRNDRLTLHQLLGKANTPLPKPLRTDIENHLRAHSVQVGEFWGDGTPLPF